LRHRIGDSAVIRPLGLIQMHSGGKEMTGLGVG